MVTGASARPIQCQPEAIFIWTLSLAAAAVGARVGAFAGAGAAACMGPCATSNWWMALSSFSMASAWSRDMPSGILMVTASAFTVFEAALVFSVLGSAFASAFAGWAFAGGAVAVAEVALDGAAAGVDGTLCATAATAHNTMPKTGKLTFTI